MFYKDLHHFRVTSTRRIEKGLPLQNYHGSTFSHVLSTRFTALLSPLLTSLHIISIISKPYLITLNVLIHPIDIRTVFYEELDNVPVTFPWRNEKGRFLQNHYGTTISHGISLLAPLTSLFITALHIISTMPNTYTNAISVRVDPVDICTTFYKDLHHFHMTFV